MSRRLNVAVIGMGGFAGEHQRAIRDLEAAGECRQVCACDPRHHEFQDRMVRWEFARRGVAIYADYTNMLEAHRHNLDLVTVPTPIPLHAEMHRAVVERGLACYLEKPPTLYHAELEEMIAADAAAPWQTMVGFSFIVEPERQTLKQRLLSGEFGKLRRVCFLGLSPRASSYYARAPWAGRLMLDGRPVLDSCIGNAMAHYIHNLLFWAGDRDLFAWEDVASVEAELYRAHAIEGTDTVFASGRCANRVEFRLAATHACVGEQFSLEWLECEKARLVRKSGESFRILWKGGPFETVTAQSRDLLRENLQTYFRYVRGDTDRPLTTLTDCRPFVALNDLAYVAAGAIATIPREQTRRSSPDGSTGENVAIWNIRDVCEEFLASGRFPSRQGVAWGRPGGRAAIDSLPKLLDVVRQMARAANVGEAT